MRCIAGSGRTSNMVSLSLIRYDPAYSLQHPSSPFNPTDFSSCIFSASVISWSPPWLHLSYHPHTLDLLCSWGCFSSEITHSVILFPSIHVAVHSHSSYPALLYKTQAQWCAPFSLVFSISSTSLFNIFKHLALFFILFCFVFHITFLENLQYRIQ